MGIIALKRVSIVLKVLKQYMLIAEQVSTKCVRSVGRNSMSLHVAPLKSFAAGPVKALHLVFLKRIVSFAGRNGSPTLASPINCVVLRNVNISIDALGKQFPARSAGKMSIFPRIVWRKAHSTSFALKNMPTNGQGAIRGNTPARYAVRNFIGLLLVINGLLSPIALGRAVMLTLRRMLSS